MKVRILNCGTMNPLLVGPLVCNVLLCELPDGLVLVDSGFGIGDLAHPDRTFGIARYIMRPSRQITETAIKQIMALGYRPDDVRHIVLTHFDTDHAGGLADFPSATVHTTAAEYSAFRSPAVRERVRYKGFQMRHRPALQTYQGPVAAWHGLSAVYQLDGLGDDIALIPMPGHTRGHAAVAVALDEGLLIHAGDAALDDHSIGTCDESGNLVPQRPWIGGIERTLAMQPDKIAANHATLTEWNSRPDVTVITAHDTRAVRSAAGVQNSSSGTPPK